MYNILDKVKQWLKQKRAAQLEMTEGERAEEVLERIVSETEK